MAKISADFQNTEHLCSKYVNTCVNIVDQYAFYLEELGTLESDAVADYQLQC